MKKFLFLIPMAALAISATFHQAGEPTSAPKNWFNLSYKDDGTRGVGTEKTYKELLAGKKADTVIVAVIDGGVDYKHEDLKNVMWHNPGEIPDNKIDDDKNGYIDDIYGWNFIGGADGKNVEHDNLELTREYRRLKKKFKNKTKEDLPASDTAEFTRYLGIQKDYNAKYDETKQTLDNIKDFDKSLTGLEDEIKAKTGKDTVTYDDFKNHNASQQYSRIHMVLKMFVVKDPEGWTSLHTEIKEGLEAYNSMLDYHLNVDYDPRSIVGDNYEDQTEKYYGNPDIKGPEAFHGTHVAGIIAAQRGNNVGIDGVCNAVLIMGVRVVPDGDERDKDVANGIRYAVDNGADIINMSFGKSYGFNKKVVDDAVKYAESKGVLLVHAAGNDSKNNDLTDNFPRARYLDGSVATNWIEVGALNWKGGKETPAPFSNYGKINVDVFAPGVDIHSTKPENGYADASGTSMASPVTAGVCAVLKAYYPNLTAADIKRIVETSSDKSMAGKKVNIPGQFKKAKKNKQGKPVTGKFSTLCKTGGIVDLYAAVQMASGVTK